MPHLRYELDSLRTTLVSPQAQLSTLKPISGPATVVLASLGSVSHSKNSSESDSQVQKDAVAIRTFLFQCDLNLCVNRESRLIQFLCVPGLHSEPWAYSSAPQSQDHSRPPMLPKFLPQMFWQLSPTSTTSNRHAGFLLYSSALSSQVHANPRVKSSITFTQEALWPWSFSSISPTAQGLTPQPYTPFALDSLT